MTCKGLVKNGVVVLDEGVSLPEGTRVEVKLAEEEQPTLAEIFKDVIGTAKGLPPDLAKNHDHYLHGRPKR